jgi:hypothetical protein
MAAMARGRVAGNSVAVVNGHQWWGTSVARGLIVIEDRWFGEGVQRRWWAFMRVGRRWVEEVRSWRL